MWYPMKRMIFTEGPFVFAILTDTSANLDRVWLEENHVLAIPFHYFVRGEDRTCLDTEHFDGAAFYAAMREGEKITTSQITPGAYEDFMRPVLARGEDVLFVSMSSGISGSCDQATLTAAALREEFPEREILVVDTLGASLGEGLLVARAVEARSAGRSIREVYDDLMQARDAMCQVFTVDDLKYLRATGRLSNVAALVGTVLNIKPLLKGNTAGKIVSFAKIRGRRRAIQGMAERYDRFVRQAGEQTVGIAHADCQADVDYLIGLLRENHPPREILTVMYEPVTGSHVGPGTLALFFFGDPAFRGKEETLLDALGQKVEAGREALGQTVDALGQKAAAGREALGQKVEAGREALRAALKRNKDK